jgi:hypothetical protein
VNGQTTYLAPMNTQFERKVDQIYEDPSWVIVPISRFQMVYTAPIMTIQANIFVGWPPLIPLNCERYKIGSVVNTRTRA